MNLEECPKCGIMFVKDAPWKTVCFQCWKAAKEKREEASIQIQELVELKEKYQALKEENARLKENNNNFLSNNLRNLIFLCHPDKHENSELSNMITRNLIGLMKGKY